MLLVALFLLGLVTGLKAECAGCDIQNTCVDVGAQHTVNCAVYNCNAAGSYSLESYGCNVNGVCKQNGDTWNDGPCVVKNCTVTTGSTWSAKIGIAYIGCSAEGECKNNSQTWNISQCQTRKCVISADPIQASIVYDFIGCPVGSGCKANGSTWEDKCYTKRCDITTTIRQTIIGAKCKGNDNSCHEPGQYFPYLTYNNCTCSVNTETWGLSYSCSG